MNSNRILIVLGEPNSIFSEVLFKYFELKKVETISYETNLWNIHLTTLFKVKTNDAMPSSAGTPLTLYTVPSATTSVVLGLLLCNIHTSAVNVSVKIESDTSCERSTFFNG